MEFSVTKLPKITKADKEEKDGLDKRKIWTILVKQVSQYFQFSRYSLNESRLEKISQVFFSNTTCLVLKAIYHGNCSSEQNGYFNKNKNTTPIIMRISLLISVQVGNPFVQFNYIPFLSQNELTSLNGTCFCQAQYARERRNSAGNPIPMIT